MFKSISDFIIIIVLFTLGIGSIESQSYDFKMFGTADGLNANHIQVLFQDSKGLLWIGTEAGLNIWDGYSFKSISRKNGYNGGVVSSICEDQYGTIWLGAVKGIYALKNGQIFSFDVGGQIERYSGLGRQLFFDKDNNLWFSTDEDLKMISNISLSHITYSNNHALSTASVFKTKNNENIKEVCGIVQCENNEIYITTKEGLYLYYEHYFRLVWRNDVGAYPENLKTYNNEDIYFSFEGPQEISCVIKIKQDSVERYNYHTISDYFMDGDRLCLVLNESLIKDVLGTKKNLKIPKKYSTSYFRHALQDKDGFLWLGTANGLLRIVKTPFDNYRNTIGEDSKQFFSSLELLDHSILLGGNQGWIYQTQNGQDFLPFLTDKQQHLIPSTEVRHLYLDLQNRLWIGSSNKGVLVIEKEQIRKYNINNHGVTDNEITFIVNCPDSNICIGTKKAIHYFNINTLDQKQQIDGGIIKSISSGIYDSFGQFWIGHDDGLSYIHNDSLKLLEDLSTEISVTCLAVDKDNKLWVGTKENGIFHYEIDQNNKLNKIANITKKSGLISNYILDLIIDNKGDLWIGSFTGISRIKVDQEYHITNLDQNDGFIKANYDHLVFNKLRSGKILITTPNGSTIFDPDDVLEINIPMGCFIQSIKTVNDQILWSFFPNNNKTTYTKPINLELNYSMNDLTIEYVAPYLKNASKIYYRHKLSGFEEKWKETSAKHEQTYSHLQPGVYIFICQARTENGQWGKECHSTFIILPPWWKTWWAYSLYTLAIFGLLYSFYRFQLKKQLAEGEADRLREVDQLKSELYTNITHEFRTPLTVIQGMATDIKDQLQKNDIPEYDDSLNMITRNSEGLLRLVNQMLDLAKVEQGKLDLNLTQSNIIPFLKYIRESFDSMSASKDIQLVYYAEEEEIVMDFDSEKIFVIISNLLSNAIKFTPNSGKIIFHIGKKRIKNQDHLLIKVKDSGIGITVENQAHIFDRFYQVDQSSTRSGEGTGIGLALTKELVELMQGDISLKSKVSKGSEFVVTIPITNKAELEKEKYFKQEVQDQSTTISNVLKGTIDSKGEKPIVLIIEDNKDVAHYIGICLANHYQTLHAENGQIGVEMAIEHLPDIIICDVMMPIKDGYEVCQELKSDNRTDHIPIIILTAKATKKDKLVGLSCGADAFLSKPFVKAELMTRLEQLVAQRRKLIKKFEGDNIYTFLKTKKEDPSSKFIQKLIKIIHDNINESNFATPQLAHKLHLSESQTYRKIKAITDKSTAKFIRTVRLQKAKEYLLSTDKNISEIAYEVGFNDPAWFSRAFKEEFGVSPGECRGD